jgi:Sec-independent protein translocase protein TatA
MGVAEILAALAAIPKIADAIKELGGQVRELRDAMTEKNLSGLKSEVNSYLTQLSKAKSSDERKRLIEEISKRISK